MSAKKTLSCDKCQMSHWCAPDNNAVTGWGNPQAPLVIVLDAPGDTEAERLLIWILRRLSLTEQDVFIDYTFKCALPRHMKMKTEIGKECYPICWTAYPRAEILAAKSVVLVGSWTAKLIANRQMKDAHGRKDPTTEAWICYSFKYLLMNPAECLDTARVIWKAAEEAGLKPVDNLSLEPFRFPTRKL